MTPIEETFPATPIHFDGPTLIYLRELSKVYPSTDAALAKIAVLAATLTLPKGSVHVISDVHGEDRKLRHVVNNASGNLRPLVQEIHGKSMPESEQLRLLSFIYYPRESYLHFLKNLGGSERRKYVSDIVGAELELIRDLARRYPLDAVAAVLPSQYIQVFRELILGPQFDRSKAHFVALIDTFVDHSRDLELLRLTARVVRNLSVSELIVAGDLGDRGPRIDRSIEFISKQPNVSITWGNHDAVWMGACLGQEACVASVVRLSLRYGRLMQLEEGYGIPLEPLERLANSVYQDDPCTNFSVKEPGGRDPALLARMQKAVAILQFKLEGLTAARNPDFALHERDLLSRLDLERKEVVVSGKMYPLADAHFPTVIDKEPLRLTPLELETISLLRESFLQSPVLWKHMRYMAQKGHMFLQRDHALIFHGCVPVDESGEFLAFAVDGVARKGKELFNAIEVAVQRAFQSQLPADLDLLWYLWSGPLSPLFGKDKIATFESSFIADKAAHHEEKNPYFKLIHEKWFCEKILAEFGVTARDGLIVNGHVPVKIERGESPVKRSGMAVTIDGAFSEAYGDKGYTLVLEADRTYLALHHHFESVADSINNGTDMVPTVQDLQVHTPPRLVIDTEQGDQIREQVALLELLIRAYRENRVSSPR
jgi:fructose-1,6-bisphosphatase-3